MRSQSKRFIVITLASLAATLGSLDAPSAQSGRRAHFERSGPCSDPRLYTGAPLADYDPPVPGTDPVPYYDHGPNWGTDPRISHPVYGIDPSCFR